MDKCLVCSMVINNHSYLIEDNPLFFTHCFACQHNLLIKEDVMKGMSIKVLRAEAREDAHIKAIDDRHIYCRYEHKRTTGRRVFIRAETMSRAQDKAA